MENTPKYDATLQKFKELYIPIYNEQQPEQQIKNNQCTIRLYQHKYDRTHNIVKRLFFKSKTEWEQRFDDELQAFENTQESQNYYYFTLKDYFLGIEGAYYVIYIVTELNRTLKGYMDYIFYEFNGFSQKLKNRPEQCNFCQQKEDEIQDYERQIQIYEDQFDSIKEVHQENERLKETVENLKKRPLSGITVSQIMSNQYAILDLTQYDSLNYVTCNEKEIKMINIQDIQKPVEINNITANKKIKFTCILNYITDIFMVGTNTGEILVYKNFIYDEKIKIKGHSKSIIGLYKSNQMGLFYSCGEDKKIICWNFSTQQQIKVFQEQKGEFSKNSLISIHSGNQFISVNSDSTIKLWQYDTKESIFTITIEKKDYAKCILDYNKQTFITGHKKKLKFWELKQNQIQLIFEQEAHQDFINEIIILKSLNEKCGQIATCSQDKFIKIWQFDVSKKYLENLKIIKGHGKPVTSLIYMNQYLISVSQDKINKIWG
ncbi:WD40-repeat-containing domain [Pseudocohnilembus persalinus]|uniref:WD40-repeat-containing domain n=1 Tax=Pseudocohnilembus persalinus TaxID=266149 RepID=A0A0V0QHK3_PSEPJ|nr:WD40-repeat-containing domain [Pseudocohnilembus persalinus]|eukprot:KRX01719.1 WD40-repeat-containing domain [Pseudocohnilembus persalinus]